MPRPGGDLPSIPSKAGSSTNTAPNTTPIPDAGTAPLDQWVVTNVRNPQQVTQWVPYTGPGRNGDRVLVPVVTSQSISVTLNCSR